jgi:hypothetical protein
MFSNFMKKNYDHPAVCTTSLHYSLSRGTVLDWDKSNQIIPGLYLGVIPVKKTWCDFLCGTRYNHSDKKILEIINKTDPKRPLTSIVSVVLPYEIQGKGFYGVTMVSPEDWKARGITHTLLKMPDFGADVDKKEAIETIYQMKKTIEKGESVYIHCKAGRGRSAMICAIYLAAFEINPDTKKLFTLDQAITFLQSKRKQIGVEPDKFKTASEILSIIEQEKASEILTEMQYLFKSQDKTLDMKL